MMLAVDIGNTNIVLGVYRKRDLLHHFRLSTARQSTVDEYGVMIHNLFHMSGISVKDVEGVIISSVVPPLVKTIEDMCIKYIGKDPLIVGPGLRRGLTYVMRIRVKLAQTGLLMQLLRLNNTNVHLSLLILVRLRLLIALMQVLIILVARLSPA